ncbi:MAG: hypothetical protein ABI451_13310 [Dokdonella sp.]
MQDQWIYSSILLPYTGETIEFKLEERGQPISGVFANGAFHSHWADYGTSRVGSWRSLDSDPSARPIEAPTSTTGSFARMFKRLKNITSRSHGSDLIAPSRDQVSTAAIAAVTLPMSMATATAYGIHSNQMHTNQMSS